MEIKAHDYQEVYEMLGISLSNLGCLMLEVEKIETGYYDIHQDGVTTYIPEYFSKNKDRNWINGYVGDKSPHLTIMYGFLNKANLIKKHIDILLGDCVVNEVEIESIGYFESPYPDEEYYCIVAHIAKTPELLRMNSLMKLLPNIQTFPDYKPHVTIAYIPKDEVIRDQFIKCLEGEYVGKRIGTGRLDYGNK